jgi:hypothetical protein
LFPFGVALFAYFVVGSLVAWIAEWPSQFGGNPDPDQSYISYLFGGSAISAPLPPAIALLIGVFLARREDRWRGVGLVLVGIVAVLFVIGVFGELFAEHPFVPTAVIVGFGIVNLLAALTLLYLVGRTARTPKP